MYDNTGNGWSNYFSNGGGYEIFDGDGNSVASNNIDNAFYQVDENNLQGPEYGLDVLCLDPGCYTFAFTYPLREYESLSWKITDGENNPILEDNSTIGDRGALRVNIYPFSVGGICGCTDDFACNYDPDADTENGTCEYETCAGCTDPNVTSYNADATIEDGSCCYNHWITITSNGFDIEIKDLDNRIVHTQASTQPLLIILIHLALKLVVTY